MERRFAYVSCFHPLLAIPRGLTETGKVKYIPVKVPPEYLSDLKRKEWLALKKEQKIKLGDKYVSPIEIPCGNCIGCRLDKSREWALRCMLELKDNLGLACFLTLTYNESSVPPSYFPDPDTGEALLVYSLRLDDLQRFWKRLRKALPDVKLRYFASGEYGSQSWRPHYHAIVFGWKPDDLVVYQENDSNRYYSSEFLEKIWTNGNVIVGDVSYDTCAYVARYTSKKSIDLGSDFFRAHNIEEPFLVMSRRPGIGWKAFDAVRSDMYSDKIYISGPEPTEGRIPRSYLQKLEELDPDLFKIVKESREKKGSVYERALAYSFKVPYSKILADEEANLLAKSRALRRNRV